MLLDIQLIIALSICGQKLSNLLSGVVFSNKAQGDKKPPCQLSSKDVSAQEKKRKEKEVFDRAMKSMENGHWKSTSFDGYPVLTETVKCDELLYNDYERVKSFLKAPLREIHTWIQCDVCESWFHDFCISRGSNTDEFICKSCR